MAEWPRCYSIRIQYRHLNALPLWYRHPVLSIAARIDMDSPTVLCNAYLEMIERASSFEGKGEVTLRTASVFYSEWASIEARSEAIGDSGYAERSVAATVVGNLVVDASKSALATLAKLR